jgi:hypothetical protein
MKTMVLMAQQPPSTLSCCPIVANRPLWIQDKLFEGQQPLVCRFQGVPRCKKEEKAMKINENLGSGVISMVPGKMLPQRGGWNDVCRADPQEATEMDPLKWSIDQNII